MNLQELISAFLVGLERRGYRPGTLKSRGSVLRQFLKWAGNLPCAQLNRELIQSYKLYLVKRPSLSKRTVYDQFQAVLRMLRWAEDAGLVLWSGLDFQEKPPPSPLRFVPTQSQMLQLLAAPPNTLLGERDRTILETIYGTGLRCGELCALNLQDLDGQGLWVRQGKGAKDRFVPIGPHLWSVLESYLKDVRPRLRAVGKSALFLARWGRRLGPVSLSWLIRRYARSLGLTGLCTHSLRHAFGTHMLEGGANLVEVKLLLGHSRLDSTQRYTQVHVAELIREYQRTHPRARRAR